MNTSTLGKLFAVALVLGGAAGCSNSVSDRCDQVCKCENCGDRERQQCTIEAQSFVDIADGYNCANAIDAYFACEVQKHSCQDEHYADDNMQCQQTFDTLNKCLDDNSGRRHGAYRAAGF